MKPVKNPGLLIFSSDELYNLWYIWWLRTIETRYFHITFYVKRITKLYRCSSTSGIVNLRIRFLYGIRLTFSDWCFGSCWEFPFSHQALGKSKRSPTNIKDVIISGPKYELSTESMCGFFHCHSLERTWFATVVGGFTFQKIYFVYFVKTKQQQG